MDTSQLAELKRWARKLQDTTRGPETRAAGKAILMLAEEIESLRAALASERGRYQEAAPKAVEPELELEAEPYDQELEEGPEAPAATGGIGRWLRRTFGGPVPAPSANGAASRVPAARKPAPVTSSPAGGWLRRTFGRPAPVPAPRERDQPAPQPRPGRDPGLRGWLRVTFASGSLAETAEERRNGGG